MKKYTSKVKLVYVGNEIICKNEEEYRERLKETFLNELNIDLQDDEIEIIAEEEIRDS